MAARTTPRTGTQQHASQGADDGSDNDTFPRVRSELDKEEMAFRGIHCSLGTSNVNSDDKDGSIQHSDSLGVSQRPVRRWRHGDTDSEQLYCPSFEDSDR